MMILAMCVAFAIGSLVCYMAVYAGAKVDRENEEYWKEMGETYNDSKTSDTTNIPEQSKTADSTTNFNLKQIYHNYGWICPVCGRGLSPYTSVCPCRGQLDTNWYITCGNQYKYNL